MAKNAEERKENMVHFCIITFVRMKRSFFAILISAVLIFAVGSSQYKSFTLGAKAPVKKTLKKEVKKAVKKKPSSAPSSLKLQRAPEGKGGASSATLTGNGATQPAEAQTVTIKDFAFSPAELTVKKGSTIIWVNQDSPKHNAFSGTAGGPQGPLLATGEKYTFKAEKVGSFDYICQPHPFMKGKITVTE